MRISDWSSDVCSSDLHVHRIGAARDDVGDERLAADATVDGAPEIDGVAHKEPVFGAHPARKTPRQFLAHLAQRPIAVRLEEEQGAARQFRSEEHTSELQSLMRISYAVFCLKKKNR